MYRYRGESANKSVLSNTEQIAQSIHSTIASVKAHFYPHRGYAKKWRDISLSFDEQLAKYGEVEKDLFFD